MSGFKKKTITKGPVIQGTVISPKSLQLLTSSGIKSLDNLINGGFPVGTIVLFEDNINSSNEHGEKTSKTSYSKVLMNHFLEEGVSHSHELFVGSCGAKFTFTPAVSSTKDQINDSEDNPKGIPSSDETLRIAWRYQNQTLSSESDKETSLNITTDKKISSKVTYEPSKYSVTTWHVTDVGPSLLLKSDIYHELFKCIYETCSATKFTIETLSTNIASSGPNLIRIGIVDIGDLTCCDQDIHGTKVGYLNTEQ